MLSGGWGDYYDLLYVCLRMMFLAAALNELDS